MNPVCNLCAHQQSANNGGVECSRASYSSNNNGYGVFKQGSRCLYDESLKVLFQPQAKEGNIVLNMSQTIKRQQDKMSELRHANGVLMERLTSVDPQKEEKG